MPLPKFMQAARTLLLAGLMLAASTVVVSPFVPLYASVRSGSVVDVLSASPKDDNPTMHKKLTLRKVVHRKPVPYMPYEHVPKYLLCVVVETLECGHKLEAYPAADPLVAVRRHCAQCDQGKVVSFVAPKKPSVSLDPTGEERRRA